MKRLHRLTAGQIHRLLRLDQRRDGGIPNRYELFKIGVFWLKGIGWARWR
jgi:hypothetical protein